VDDSIGRGLRRGMALLAAATLAFALAGCGGGGGASSTPESPGGGTSSGPESAYLLAEFVARDSNNQFVRVWDPAHPGVAIQEVRIVESNGIVWTGSHLVFSDATRYDPVTRSVTTLGHAKVFFDNDGKVYSIDLRGGQPHAPVQLSAATDANGIAAAFALDAAGDDAWVDVAGVAHHWAVRATMSAADAPRSMMGFDAMRDGATGLPRYLFVRFGGESGTAVQPTTFGVRTLDFQPVAEPAVEAMGGYDEWMAPDPAQPGLAYLRIAGQLRALRWSAGGVAVDAGSLHDFPLLDIGPQPLAADARALYFADATALLAVENGVVRAVGAFGHAPFELADAGGAIVGAESQPVSATCCTLWETVSKADGTTAQAASGDTTMRLVAAGEAGLVFTGATVQRGGVATLDEGYEVIDAAGTTLRTSGNWAVGLVRAATARLDQPAAPVGMLTCTPDVMKNWCIAGSLAEVDVATGAVITFGAVAAGSQYMHGDLVDGLPGAVAGQTLLASPGGFGVDETDTRDAWQLTPGVAGSLLRVTSNLP
jgi:hypothetical protein